ncbi:MAG: family 20 glycosylhydrolase [Rikenellaceae bacterium]
MIRQLELIIALVVITIAQARGQEVNWTLPTPDAELLTTSLIPYPESVVRLDGEFEFSHFEPSFEAIDSAELLELELAEVSSYWEINKGRKSSRCRVKFIESDNESYATSGEYKIECEDREVKIYAAECEGYFNALQTLRQLIKRDGATLTLPNCIITDKPAFPIRGIMLDIGRNYMSPNFIKGIIRRLSYYKLNTLHLHLTEDPAWRIEVHKYPQLTDTASFWPTRQPGMYYTQDELKEIVEYCSTINVRVIPEVDMPGHSKAFTTAVGYNMQSEEGMAILKEAIDEIVPLFKDPLFHIGSDEVRFTMPEFMPEMIQYIRDKGKEVIVWSPGYAPDDSAIKMLWCENEAGAALDKSARYIDTNGFYLDYMESQGGVLQTFFQQPCEVSQENENAMGSVMCVWTDGALSSENRVLEQYPFYPCLLTYAERAWRGANEKRRDLMAKLPDAGTEEMRALSEFEDRLVYHRDNYFKGIPFSYVKQSEIEWRLIGPFDHGGQNDKQFEPEFEIKESYASDGQTLRWNETIAYGGLIQFRNLYTMFNMHNNRFQPEHWPTIMSSAVGLGDGTCYALTYIESDKDQEVYLMFGINGMWGHSGGYRTSRAPQQGQWDFNGGDLWINDQRIAPPHWPFESLPWTGWGQGRIETPLTEEGYFYRPPIKISLKKGYNKVLVKSVFGHWKGDDGQRKWQFCFIPVNWDGTHYSEVEGLKFTCDPQISSTCN